MKKFLILLLCLVVMISIVGCNENSESGGNTDNPNSSTAGNSSTAENSSANNTSGTIEILGSKFDIAETTDLLINCVIFDANPNLKTKEDKIQAFNEVVEVIKQLKNLEALGIVYGESFLSDYDFSFLEELPNLKVLSLAGNGITDCEQFANLTNLEMLDLLGISKEADITPLANLPKLKEVLLIGSSEDKINWLQEQLPDCSSMYASELSYKFKNKV
ncbi:MAG: leucine-rich repeat domain-containing protein [Oscillospiraceae bacterium]|nr:leucine-rich repeat domain-containing protein [Oscillospiraceae bacterium]